jgi:hypothetical protein
VDPPTLAPNKSAVRSSARARIVDRTRDMKPSSVLCRQLVPT